ncbi:MAG TPA: hypothetical protein VM580_01635, partial [Labilithrix sp.]|nr:hypothetical protein [Labilithrix sp.]
MTRELGAKERRTEKRYFTSAAPAGSPRAMRRGGKSPVSLDGVHAGFGKRRTGCARTFGAFVTCAGVLTLSLPAGAESTMAERLRVQGGFITQARPRPAPRVDDVFIGAVPELALYWARPSGLFSLNYQLTGALHSLSGASEIANRLVLASLWDMTSRATLILSAEAAQTSFSNLLISRQAADSTVALFPPNSNRIFSARVNEGINYE